MANSTRNFLRHTLATLAYRVEKPLRKAPRNFMTVRAGEKTRSAGEILAHLCDLIEWADSAVGGKPVWRPRPIKTWDDGVKRFYRAMKKLDRSLASANSLVSPAERIFQGPIADALTHVGQLATLRRLAGSPVRGENYFRAEIEIGRVGPKQSPKRVEFD